MADIFGEFIDLRNGLGNDDPSVRWLMGEDLPHVSPNGALRNLRDPSQNHTLDERTTEDRFDFRPLPGASRTADEYWMWSEIPGTTKSHYVNLGVGTRFASLLTDGGNGVTGIGEEKAARIIFRAASELSNAPSFGQFGARLMGACNFLAGTSRYNVTANDCTKVRSALTAVGIPTSPPNDRGGNDYLARDPSTGRKVHVTDGQAWTVTDSAFNCLAQSLFVWDIPTFTTPHIRTNGVTIDCDTPTHPWTYTPTAQGGNTGVDVILRTPAGNAWHVNTAGEIQHIPDGGTYLCLAMSHPAIWNVPDSKITDWAPNSTVPATCGTNGGPEKHSTTLVSTRWDGTQTVDASLNSDISADGRWITYYGHGRDLVPGGTYHYQVALWDRDTGTTTLVSTTPDGSPGNDSSLSPTISADGRWIAYLSNAWNLVPGDTQNTLDLFLWDRHTGATTLVSVLPDGTRITGDPSTPAISADGRWIGYHAGSSNLVPEDGLPHGFLWDRDTGTTTYVSGTPDGFVDPVSGGHLAISADGRYIAFVERGVFVWDRVTGATTLVSADGHPSLGAYGAPSISADGRWITYGASYRANLEIDSTDYLNGVFLWDRETGATTPLFLITGGRWLGGFGGGPKISEDGRWVAFDSSAPDLVLGDTDVTYDVFLWDRDTEVIRRVSTAFDGSEADDESGWVEISADGRWVTYVSWASNLVPGDANGMLDVFVSRNPVLE